MLNEDFLTAKHAKDAKKDLISFFASFVCFVGKLILIEFNFCYENLL